MSLPAPPPAHHERRHILRFLDAHLQQGGLEQHTHAMLRQVVRLMNQVSHCLFPPSHIFREDIKQRLQLLCRNITAILDVFGEHLLLRWNYAEDAENDLPDLAVNSVGERRRRLWEWQERLHGTHEPNDDDTTMYICFRLYFDEHVWIPFLQLHSREPEHGSWQVQEDLAFVRACLELLHDLCGDANRLVTELDREFAVGLRTLGSDSRANSPREAAAGVAPGNDAVTVADVAIGARLAYQALSAFDSFFEGHDSGSRGSSTDEGSYSFSTEASAGLVSTRPNSPSSGRTSRVFTGSFSDLEESLKRLFMEQGLEAEPGSQVKVKDFALATPRLLPSPATLLERRDALSVREAEWNHHIVAGKLVKSRRPHDRQRAQTIDDVTGGLEAWLSREPSLDEAANNAIKAGMRRLERQCTI